MKTICLTAFIFIVFISIAYSHWVPRDTNTNVCYKLNDYVIYSDKRFLSYSEIKACYESTPYNKTNATKRIETVKENLKAFYVLLEQLKEDPLLF
ncbi:19327_t:CDS:2, partial [Gigaspora margarita]